jgi:hypothetical protein
MGNGTSSSFNLQYMPKGIVQPTGKFSKEVPMGWQNREIVVTSTTEHLWTQHASDCCIVCTYTPATGVRSMTHLQGGAFSTNFFSELAAIVQADSTIIIASGGYATADNWNAPEGQFETMKEELKKGIKLQAGRISIPFKNFKSVYSPDVYTVGNSVGFVFKKSGRYGVLSPTGFGS